MSLGLGGNLTSSGLITPGVVTDNLVMKHMYPAGAVQPLSDGAVDINADAANNEYIDVGAISLTTNDVSVSAWVYVTDFVENGGIICNRESGGTEKGIILRTDSSGPKFQALLDYGGGSFEVNSDNANTNEWYHVCATWDRSGNASMYVNGVLHNTTDISAQSSVNITHSTVAKIGQHQGTVEFRGYICNAGYWDRVLTQAEIKSIMWKQYADLTTSEKTNLVSFWNLDSTSIADMDNTNVTIDSVGTLGSELVDSDLVIGDFDAYGSNVISLDNGVLTTQYVDNDDGVKLPFRLTDGILSTNTTSGSFYQLQLDAKVNTGSANLRISTDTDYKAHEVTNTDWETFTIYLKANSTTSTFLRLQYLSTAEIMYIKNISFKEISGNNGTLS